MTLIPIVIEKTGRGERAYEPRGDRPAHRDGPRDGQRPHKGGRDGGRDFGRDSHRAPRAGAKPAHALKKTWDPLNSNPDANLPREAKPLNRRKKRSNGKPGFTAG